MFSVSTLVAQAAVAATVLHPHVHQVPVTPSVHTVAATHANLTAAKVKQTVSYKMVTVQSGDDLAKLAETHNVPGGWMSIYAANTDKIKNPDEIFPGQQFKLPSVAMTAVLPKSNYAPRHAAVTTSATGDGDGLAPGGAMCKPNCWGDGDKDGFDLNHSPFGSTAPASAPASTATTTAAVSSPVQSSSTVNPNSYSGFQACVIARESGGNSQVMNSSGHYGLYQFSASTWEAYGGSASTFGNASVAEQNQVFANAMAQGGQSNWSPYDGC